MKRSILSAVLVLVGAAACSSTSPDGRQVFLTQEQSTVWHQGPNQPFEVRLKAGYGAPDFWCAAGRFATSQGKSLGSRIYRLTPSPRPSGSGMVFTFTKPPGGGQPTGLGTIIGDRYSLSVSGAREQCRAIQLRNRNRR